MENRNILFGTVEIERLYRLSGRVDALVDYVMASKFSIEREVCAAILGFRLEDKDIPLKEDTDEPLPL